MLFEQSLSFICVLERFIWQSDHDVRLEYLYMSWALPVCSLD